MAANPVVDLVAQLLPLVFRAIREAIEAEENPLEVIKAAMDSEEALAILAEHAKFREDE